MIHQREQVQDTHAVLRTTQLAALQLVQAVGDDRAGQLAARVHAGQQHTHTLVSRGQHGLREENLLRRGDAR